VSDLREAAWVKTYCGGKPNYVDAVNTSQNRVDKTAKSGEKHMKHEEIFNLAQDNGVCDDFGCWNFTDQGLVNLVLTVLDLERERIANQVKEVLDDAALNLWTDINKGRK